MDGPHPTLDYAKPESRRRDTRGLRLTTCAWLVLYIVVSAWWRGGIRYGQWYTGGEILFEPATGTAFWDTWAISAPAITLFGGAMLLSVVQVLMAIRCLWCQEQMYLIAFGWFFTFCTCCVNVPLIEEASP